MTGTMGDRPGFVRAMEALNCSFARQFIMGAGGCTCAASIQGDFCTFKTDSGRLGMLLFPFFAGAVLLAGVKFTNDQGTEPLISEGADSIDDWVEKLMSSVMDSDDLLLNNSEKTPEEGGLGSALYDAKLKEAALSYNDDESGEAPGLARSAASSTAAGDEAKTDGRGYPGLPFPKEDGGFVGDGSLSEQWIPLLPPAACLPACPCPRPPLFLQTKGRLSKPKKHLDRLSRVCLASSTTTTALLAEFYARTMSGLMEDSPPKKKRKARLPKA